jgi:hypothetical protein
MLIQRTAVATEAYWLLYAVTEGWRGFATWWERMQAMPSYQATAHNSNEALLDDKAGQVPLRKPLVHRRRQKVPSLAINRTEIAQLRATLSRRKAESIHRFYPTLLSALSPTGC